MKEKFFLRAEASYKVKSSDGRFARAANAVLGKYRLEKKAKQWPGKGKDLQGLPGLF